MIYLDYASTYPTHKQIIEKLPFYFENYDFNPSSVYSKAIKARTFLNDLRNRLSFLLNVDSSSIFFTSSATESLNTVLKGLNYKQKNKIIVWDVEHKAVLETVKNIQNINSVLINTADKPLNYESIKPHLDSNVKLVSLMHVNNETGCVNNITDIAKKIKEFDNDILILSDMSQSFCKIDTSLEYVDFAVMSAHKIGGLKGCGVLFARKPELLTPLINGGGQEMGLRAGTENIISIAAFEEAVLISKKMYEEKREYINNLNNKLIDFCNKHNFHINSPKQSVPYIFNFSTMKLSSEILVNYLSSKEIFVSSASACSGKTKSYVIEKMGFTNKIIDTSIRVSICPNTKMEDIDKFISEVNKAVKELSF